MLAYFLSVLVGTGSVGLYLAAFFLPEIHRKNDLIWSGIGLFYALVLWVEAPQLNGGLLLGQTASVLLLGWFAWQTVMLRRQVTAETQRSPWPEFGWNKTKSLSTPSVSEVAVSSDPPQAWIEIRQEFPKSANTFPEKTELTELKDSQLPTDQSSD